MSPPWWLGHSPATARVECGDGEHHLVWNAGQLHAHDHPDLDAERALAALGGRHCACLDILDAWAAHAGDLRVLTLASRGADDPLRWSPRPVPNPAPLGRPRARTALSGAGFGTAVIGTMIATGSGGPPPMVRPPEQDELLQLLTLAGALPQRLVAEVAANWAENLAAGDAGDRRAELVAALYGRSTRTLRAWLGEPNLNVEVNMVDPGRARIRRHGDTLHAELPFGWVADVWAKGLAVTLGRLCLETIDATDNRIVLSSIDPDLTDPRPLTLTLG